MRSSSNVAMAGRRFRVRVMRSVGGWADPRTGGRTGGADVGHAQVVVHSEVVVDREHGDGIGGRNEGAEQQALD